MEFEDKEYNVVTKINMLTYKGTFENNPIKIKNMFQSHACDKETVDLMREIRGKFCELALFLNEKLPNNKEKETALTQLKISMMCSNDSVSQKYPIAEGEKYK